MAKSGDAIFANLPLLFAIGVAIGLTENDGVAALAGTTGYVVFLAALGVCAKLRGIDVKPIMGIPSIETGVFGGIIVGLVAAWGFNRFYKIKLPPCVGFFAGKRSVPIITPFIVIAVGAILSFIWPPIGNGSTPFTWAVNEQPALAFTFTAWSNARSFHSAASRLECAVLFPGGLIHRSRHGNVVHGEIARFIAGDPTAGHMSGGYLLNVGLPPRRSPCGAALVRKTGPRSAAS
jgi:PTS system glucose-specific IIC component